MKKKIFLWRGNIHLLQHFSAVFAAICLTILFLNSFLTFEYVSGNQVYSNMYFINPLDSSGEFENSEVFTELLNSSIEEIVRYAVIKSQLETEGELDGDKVIDIVAYANRKNISKNEGHYALSANYYLEDLIKCGRYEETYTEVYFETMWDAVSFFDANVLENYRYVVNLYQEEGFHLRYDGTKYYYIDENGIYIPVYKGAGSGCTVTFDIATIVENAVTDKAETDSETAEITEEEEKAAEEVNESPILKAAPSMLDTLVSTAYYYEISVNSGTDYVVESAGSVPGAAVNMLDERYKTVGGSTLLELASDWKEYFTLSENLIYSADSLEYNYNQYQAYRREYNNSSLKFCLSMVIDGERVLYGNDEMLLTEQSLNRDEYFRKNFDKYIIYCPGEILYVTNTDIEEQKIFEELNHYSYAYPENTKLWIGVNTQDYDSGDKVARAAAVFDGFMPKAWLYIIEAVLGILCWFFCLIYLCMVTGKKKDKEGVEYNHLYWFDKIPTEIALVLLGILSASYLAGLYVNIIYIDRNFTALVEKKPISIYVNMGFQALAFSLLITAFLYSLIRRIKGKNIWKSSVARFLCLKLFKVIKWVIAKIKAFIILAYDNGRIMTRTILPFLILIILNVIAGIFSYRYLYAGISYGKFFFSLSARSLIACIMVILIGAIDVGVLAVLWWNQIQRNKIVDGINQICKGNTAYKIDMESMHGENRILANAVNNIGDSIQTAVETSTKDEKLKADLITNVSHDIKTPLTSIINYVDLLKREHVETEPIKGYIAVLDAKSQRLKQLTDDLVEASKISSGNITLIMDRINLTELLNQALGEFEEKFAKRGLIVVAGYDRTPICIMADSRRIWRVIENLLNNVYKYAMEGTRVYLDMEVKKDKVKVSLKNISAQPLNIGAEELTERFIRGDVSRSTEGSGLGLSIAQNLTTLQGGEFNIYLDGDLFKVMLVFPVAKKEETIEKKEDAEE